MGNQSNSRYSAVMLATAIVCLAAAVTVQTARSAVTVRLTDGRVIRGDAIGPETDQRRIAVSRTSTTMTITRHVAWSRVSTVSIDGRPVSISELRAARITPVSQPSPEFSGLFDGGGTHFVPPFAGPPAACVDGPGPFGRVLGYRRDPLSGYAGFLARYFPQGVPVAETGFALELARARLWNDAIFRARDPLPAPVPGAGRHSPPANIEEGPPPPPAGPIVPPGAASRQSAAGISARARLMRTAGTADLSSLLVELAAFDSAGRPYPVQGTVRLTLRGSSQKLLRAAGSRFVAFPADYRQIGRWTRAMHNGRKRNVVPLAARLVLPLPRPLPDHDLSIGPWGELHVMLLSPGHGQFETAVRGIRLREASGIRDRHRAATGSRFFADERTLDRTTSSGPTVRRDGILRARAGR